MEFVKENINFANVCSDSFKSLLDRDDDSALFLKENLSKKGDAEEILKASMDMDNDGSEEFVSEMVPFIKEEPIGIWEHNSIDLDTLDEESERNSLRMNDLDFNHGFVDWMGNSVDDNSSDNQSSLLMDSIHPEFIKCETTEETEKSLHPQNLFHDSLWIDCSEDTPEDVSSDSGRISRNERESDFNVSLSCEICKKNFQDRMFLYNHLKEFHHCNIIFECDTCRKIFLNKTSLIAHLSTHSKRKVPEKKVEAPAKATSVDSDSQDSDEAPQTTISCEICGKHFVEKIFLYNHLKAFHSCNVIFECDTCHKIFLNDKSLLLHLETHTKKNKRNKMLECDLCSKKFSWQLSLDQHRLKHYFERNYVCNVCSKRFSHESELDLHKVSHSSDGYLQCNICARKFTRQCNLVQHKRVHNRNFGQKC